jgi:hypothetical protein
VIDQKDGTEEAIAELESALRPKRKVSKWEWLCAALDGRERAGYTGRIVVVLDYKAGSIRQMRIEEVTATHYSD